MTQWLRALSALSLGPFRHSSSQLSNFSLRDPVLSFDFQECKTRDAQMYMQAEHISRIITHGFCVYVHMSTEVLSGRVRSAVQCWSEEPSLSDMVLRVQLWSSAAVALTLQTS